MLYNIVIIVVSILLIFLLLRYLFYSVNPQMLLYTKSEILDPIKEYSADYMVINRNSFDNSILSNLKYPIVFKPDFCHNFAIGVELIHNETQAQQYIKDSIDDLIIFQKYHHGPYEGTILYSKHPLTNTVSMSIVERLPSEKDKNTQWLWKNAVSAKKHNYTSKNREDLETEELKKKIEIISNKLPEFYFGRYDIRFDSYDNLKNGKGFKILELNLNPSDTRVSQDKSFFYNFKLVTHLVLKRLEYGFINMLRLKSPSIKDSIKFIEYNIHKLIKCDQAKFYKESYNKKKNFVKKQLQYKLNT